MSTSPRPPVEVFVSYSHEDEDFRRSLGKHLSLLQRQQRISVWHDRRISAGADWKGLIDSHLQSAGMVLLLVSPSFVASDYCYDLELKEALRRRKDEGIPVIPILVRPVDWTSSVLGSLQALPRNARPVTEWADRDAAFRDIVLGIRAALDGEELASATPEKFQHAGRRSRRWTGLVVAAGVLTILTRVFFGVTTPQAPPMGLSEIVVVMALWFAGAAAALYAAHAVHDRVTARRRARTGPNSKDAAASP